VAGGGIPSGSVEFYLLWTPAGSVREWVRRRRVAGGWWLGTPQLRPFVRVGMETVVALAIPGWVVLLLAVGLYELVRRRRGRRTISGTFADELTAAFYGSKRMELEHRTSVLMMRKGQAQGDPPRMHVDLDAGVARLRPEAEQPG
jgi:hypothetical protein